MINSSFFSQLSSQRIGFIGFGDIASRAAKQLQLQDANHQLYALRRNAERVDASLAEAITFDLSKPESLAALKQAPLNAVDYWVVTLTPDGLDDAAYVKTYVEGARAIAAALADQPFKKLFWVSSSSVYGQANDEWVDEVSVTEPQRFSGKRQLEAEQAIQALGDKVCVLRFSGIYRDTQHRMLTAAQDGRLPSTFEEDYFTNRIQVDDAAAVLLHLIARDAVVGDLAPLYLASDDCPIKYSDLIQAVAELTGCALNDALPAAKKRINSKRCSNRLLRDSGFEFSFPSFREGFKHCLHNAGKSG